MHDAGHRTQGTANTSAMSSHLVRVASALGPWCGTGKAGGAEEAQKRPPTPRPHSQDTETMGPKTPRGGVKRRRSPSLDPVFVDKRRRTFCTYASAPPATFTTSKAVLLTPLTPLYASPTKKKARGVRDPATPRMSREEFVYIVGLVTGPCPTIVPRWLQASVIMLAREAAGLRARIRAACGRHAPGVRSMEDCLLRVNSKLEQLVGACQQLMAIPPSMWPRPPFLTRSLPLPLHPLTATPTAPTPTAPTPLAPTPTAPTRTRTASTADMAKTPPKRQPALPRPYDLPRWDSTHNGLTRSAPRIDAIFRHARPLYLK